MLTGEIDPEYLQFYLDSCIECMHLMHRQLQAEDVLTLLNKGVIVFIQNVGLDHWNCTLIFNIRCYITLWEKYMHTFSKMIFTEIKMLNYQDFEL